MPGSAPNFYTVPHHFRNATYAEWNFAIQQELDRKTALTLNYVGNHGYDLITRNNGANAYFTHRFRRPPVSLPRIRASRLGYATSATRSLQLQRADCNLGAQVHLGFQGSLNYTWSHALDETSNGGSSHIAETPPGDSLHYQIDPLNLRRFNYGNADYDFRRLMSVSLHLGTSIQA